MVDDIASIFPKEVETAWKSWNKNMSFPFKTTLDVFSWLENIRYQDISRKAIPFQICNLETSWPHNQFPLGSLSAYPENDAQAPMICHKNWVQIDMIDSRNRGASFSKLFYG